MLSRGERETERDRDVERLESQLPAPPELCGPFLSALRGFGP